MATTDTLLARAEPWVRTTLRDWLLGIILLLIIVFWWWIQVPLNMFVAGGLFFYAAVHLGWLFVLREARSAQQHIRLQVVQMAGIVADVAISIWLIMVIAPFDLIIFPIYMVMGLKVVYVWRSFLPVVLVPTLFGPLYLAASYRSQADFALLRADQVLAFWSLIAASCLFVCLLVALAERRLRRADDLALQLVQTRVEHEARVAELESSNTDLRVRIRRQQSLEESLRAITGSLSLDEVLSQILDSMLQMLGAPRVSAAGLSLVSGAGFTHRTLGMGDVAAQMWAQPLAQQVVQSHAPVVVGDALLDADWVHLQRAGVLSALSVPLIDPHNHVIGALTVVSTQRHAFTPTEARHLTSFSIQASVAIQNAELHTRLEHQQAMLQAVVRDIGDGLIVVDAQGAMVIANPVAYQTLQKSDAHGDRLRDDLDRMSQELRAHPQALIQREVHFGEDDQQRAYQIFASLVHTEADDDASYVALVIHDISDQKLQERRQFEFISMVSHELRNPLNTLNGFLKVVLQGKAGPLNELQQEFLGLADGQADALKGRITELLEYNRLESGRLRLQPQWSDLADLLLRTSTRFQIQAEQFGLTIETAIPTNIPEVLMDPERIGQVLTNLIENAMKATPAGGKIALRALVQEQYVLVQVADTGVGIPEEQREKIFSRFYRLEHTSSLHGVHLGLGLSICQQIVEGHNGRIWVESAVAQGSCFNFTLPLVRREQMIREPVA
ncbi:multi-sensor signal transduction histidine kinase [Oscillochloris trichoides DG-6]|uniref:histidine kinase n=1 Tax=Oscillochloris trichoides DG-6 TaxID=765420 RepID=E1IH40_9CHLR|nr:ATP-binding protein [Oscillochloris trichoides]EFO79515.1 multi-sensor signal transduction histidine kinase [Oscillochloris trichoides DG-6]